ncbi:MAG TPA: type II toxin-antitoxin system HicA family toxin [bacterium]|nr:type II toxin-antitoxin system HicA family toxin [bacterium]
MKRRDLIQHLIGSGCLLKREGGKHSVFVNATTGKMSTVPRHTGISDTLAKKICADLGIPQP